MCGLYLTMVSVCVWVYLLTFHWCFMDFSGLVWQFIIPGTLRHKRCMSILNKPLTVGLYWLLREKGEENHGSVGVLPSGAQAQSHILPGISKTCVEGGRNSPTPAHENEHHAMLLKQKTKCHKLRGRVNRNVFSQSSGGWKSDIWVLAWSSSSEAFLPGGSGGERETERVLWCLLFL